MDVPDFHETIEAFDDYNQSVINKEGLALAAQGCNVSTILTSLNNIGNVLTFHVGEIVIFHMKLFQLLMH